LHDCALFTDVTQPQWLGHIASADPVDLGWLVEFGPTHVIFTSPKPYRALLIYMIEDRRRFRCCAHLLFFAKKHRRNYTLPDYGRYAFKRPPES
jgi:hypothetical protein